MSPEPRPFSWIAVPGARRASLVIRTLAPIFVLACSPAFATTWYVGNTALYSYPGISATVIKSSICNAVNSASTGDTVLVDYRVVSHNDYCPISVDLKISGWSGNALNTSPGLAITYTDQGITGVSPNHGVFRVTHLARVEIDYLDISSPYPANCTNCAAVWVDAGASLTLRHDKIHNCINGVLTGIGEFTGDLLFEYSEFYDNGYDVYPGGTSIGLSHNIYVGNAHSLTMRYCWSHGSIGGHLVKSRAERNFLYYNKFDAEPDVASYVTNALIGTTTTYQSVSNIPINIPVGGTLVMVGNIVVGGPNQPSFHGSTTGKLQLVQFDDECTSDGITHGKHPYKAADITQNIGTADSSIAVVPSYLYNWPTSGIVTATIRTYGRLLAKPSGTTGTSLTLDPNTIQDFPNPATTGTYLLNSGNEQWSLQALNYVTGAATITRGANGSRPTTTHYQEDFVEIANPEQVSFPASSINSSTGVITNVARGLNGVGFATTHAVKPGVELQLSTPASDLYLVNNTFVLDPGGNAWSNTQIPAIYAPIGYGLTEANSNVPNNPTCWMDQNANVFLANNAFYLPQVGLVDPGTGKQSNSGRPWALGFSRSWADLSVDAHQANKVTSAHYTFTTADVGRKINFPGNSKFKAQLLTIDGVSGGAAILSGNAGIPGANGGRWELWGDLAQPTEKTDSWITAESNTGYPFSLQSLFYSPAVYLNNAPSGNPATVTSGLASGIFDYSPQSNAFAWIGQGTDMTSSTFSLPCGGVGLPELCGLQSQDSYMHPLNWTSRANTQDIGAVPYINGYAPSNVLTVSMTSANANSAGVATVTLPAPLTYDAAVAFLSSDETILHRPGTVFLPAGATQATAGFTTDIKTGTATLSAFLAGTASGSSMLFGAAMLTVK